ncbi:MAG: PKD domain-containing protein [Chloroflexaceae bacterium]|nr:PKD domain-containing protein [Chloroflexaceae bacterium]
MTSSSSLHAHAYPQPVPDAPVTSTAVQQTQPWIDADKRGMVIRDPWYDFGTYPGLADEPNTVAQDRMGQMLEHLGVRWVRLEFQIEGHDVISTTQVAQYDYFIREVAPRHNFKVLGLLGFSLLRGVPRCDLASLDTWDDPIYGGGINYYMETWLNRARMIVDRYEDQIAAYQVLNEQNRLTPECDFIPPTMAARLHTKFYRFFRQVDRFAPGTGDQSWRDDSAIVLGGLHPAGTSKPGHPNYQTDREYLLELYQSDGFASYRATYGAFPIDGLGYHPYPEEIRNSLQSDMSLITDRLDAVRNVLEIVEDPDLPFWITEIGYNSAFGSQDDAGQAEFMRRVLMLLSKRTDVEVFFWFKYEDFPPATGPNAQQWGVVRVPFEDGDCPGGACYDVAGRPVLLRPSFWVYRELAGLTYSPPEPPASATIQGPLIGKLATPITLTATLSRTTVTTPVTYLWHATDQQSLTRDGVLSDTVSYTWETPGSKVVTLEARNQAGPVLSTYRITINATGEPLRLFLPFVQRRSP